MAEPPAVAPAEVAMSGPDVLLATKLHLPRPRPGFVPRPRLAADTADSTVAWNLLDQYEPEILILVAGANPGNLWLS